MKQTRNKFTKILHRCALTVGPGIPYKHNQNIKRITTFNMFQSCCHDMTNAKFGL